jgi:drug/metabolite transporter (DMT)-like permease
LTTKNNSWIPGYIALGITWGASFLFIKWGLLSLSPIGVAFFRGFIGGLTLLIYALVTKQKLPNKFSEIRHLVVIALLMNTVPGYLFAVGETHVSSVAAGIINATTPLMTVLVISVAFREQKININQGLGVVIGFIGVLLVTNIFDNSASGSIIGILELLLATLCYGIAVPYSRKFVSQLPYSSTALATVQVCSSAILLSPFVLMKSPLQHPWNHKSIMGMLLLGSIGTGIAYIWNFRNVKIAGSVVASTVTYLTPIVAAILGVLLLKEKVHFIQLLGGVLILLSATLVQGRLKLVKK